VRRTLLANLRGLFHPALIGCRINEIQERGIMIPEPQAGSEHEDNGWKDEQGQGGGVLHRQGFRLQQALSVFTSFHGTNQ